MLFIEAFKQLPWISINCILILEANDIATIQLQKIA